jgi:hypothetical protein
MCEVVRPLLSLLHPECNALENFEALMALCNLAAFDAPRKRIVKEQGISKIESYMYEEHEMLRRASVQTINNMLFNEEVVKMFEGKNDRTKFLFLLTTSEDLELSKAALGSLAILTSASKRASRKIFDVQEWKETIGYSLSNENREVQYRAAVIVNNIVSHSKELAEKLLAVEVLEVLEVLTKFGTSNLIKLYFLLKYSLIDSFF